MADILITDVDPAVLRDLEARARTRGSTVEAIARERLVAGVARWRQDIGEQEGRSERAAAAMRVDPPNSPPPSLHRMN